MLNSNDQFNYVTGILRHIHISSPELSRLGPVPLPHGIGQGDHGRLLQVLGPQRPHPVQEAAELVPRLQGHGRAGAEALLQ